MFSWFCCCKSFPSLTWPLWALIHAKSISVVFCMPRCTFPPSKFGSGVQPFLILMKGSQNIPNKVTLIKWKNEILEHIKQIDNNWIVLELYLVSSVNIDYLYLWYSFLFEYLQCTVKQISNFNYFYNLLASRTLTL